MAAHILSGVKKKGGHPMWPEDGFVDLEDLLFDEDSGLPSAR